jgi:hypothetical protein
MKLAKIVKSNSHVDYVGRVLDRLDTASPPAPEDYRFGRFVAIPADAEPVGNTHSCAVGLIYNSQLVNPDYGQIGPRLSSSAEMNVVFSPDLINEQGVLIGILLVGWIDWQGVVHQGVPLKVIPVNSPVNAMSDAEVLSFHTSRDGRLALHYYPNVMVHARQFAQQLMLTVLDQIEALLGKNSTSEIELLRRTIKWQLVFQSKSP